MLIDCSWVYYEMGTMCHVKAVEGTRRDNVTDLIKVYDIFFTFPYTQLQFISDML